MNKKAKSIDEFRKSLLLLGKTVLFKDGRQIKIKSTSQTITNKGFIITGVTTEDNEEIKIDQIVKILK